MRGRRFTAVLTVLLLSVSQLAVAMHACSLVQPTSAGAHHAADSGRDCDCPLDASNASNGGSAICKQHCESGNQNLAKPFVADHIVLAAVLAIPGVGVVESAHGISPSAIERVATSPPFLRNAILRI